MSKPDRSQPSDPICTQASVVPFRHGSDGPEFCLITTRRSGRWGFPKGSIRDHESVEAAALSEALEEAGLTGHIVGPQLGQYQYSKRGGQHTVSVMLMHVRDCTRLWKEGAQRERCWATYEQALQLLDRENLTDLLQAAMTLLSGTPALAADETPLSA